MPTLTVTKNYSDNNVLTEAHLDAAFESVETFVNTTKLDSSNLQAAAVTETQLGSAAVTEAKIATGAVTTAKIADGAITGAKLAATTADNSTLEYDATNDYLKVKASGITATQIASDAVTTAKILNANVTTAKIADSNITTAKILDRNVTTAKIALGAVTSNEIEEEGIVEPNLAANCVTTVKIADANVTTAKLADGAVTQAKRAALGQQVSSSSGADTNTTTTYADVDNCSVSLTTTGRPVFIALISAGTGNGDGSIWAENSSGNQCAGNIKFVRDSTDLAAYFWNFTGDTNNWQLIVPASLFYIDVPSAGTYTYKVQFRKSAGSTTTVNTAKLVAYEL
jgi:hypothetical protein